jgi:hypothetical protein
MSYVLFASKVMKASEVLKVCKEARENPYQLYLKEVELKEMLQDKKEKAAS